jgi:hypothetical protein
MENLIGKTNLVICSWYNVPTLFRNLQKEVFSGQGAWHSPNTLPHGNCVKGGKENNLEKLLENYLRQFTEETRYHNDPRYVSAWIRYVSFYVCLLSCV